MINLIPPEGYRMIKYEYLLRVGAVYCFLFSLVFFLVSIALIPLYILVNAQIKDISLDSVVENNTTEMHQVASTTVGVTNKVLTQLSEPEQPFLISAAIHEIQGLAPEGVTFKTFNIDGAQKKVGNIQVQGNAPTREKLAQLKTALEASAFFKSVEVPISDLARDVDLSFSITILPAQ